MDHAFDETTLRRLVTAHIEVDAARPCFEPIRTGKHNRSYVVHAGARDMILRIAPPQEGMIFYEPTLCCAARRPCRWPRCMPMTTRTL